jgi:hypothetical protein
VPTFRGKRWEIAARLGRMEGAKVMRRSAAALLRAKLG